MDNSQVQQALGNFLGHHRSAVVSQESTWQAPFLDRLGEAVHPGPRAIIR